MVCTRLLNCSVPLDYRSTVHRHHISYCGLFTTRKNLPLPPIQCGCAWRKNHYYPVVFHRPRRRSQPRPFALSPSRFPGRKIDCLPLCVCPASHQSSRTSRSHCQPSNQTHHHHHYQPTNPTQPHHQKKRPNTTTTTTKRHHHRLYPSATATPTKSQSYRYWKPSRETLAAYASPPLVPARLLVVSGTETTLLRHQATPFRPLSIVAPGSARVHQVHLPSRGRWLSLLLENPSSDRPVTIARRFQTHISPTLSFKSSAVQARPFKPRRPPPKGHPIVSSQAVPHCCCPYS